MEEVLQNPLIENDIVKNYPIRIMENKNIIELVNIINKL